MPGKIAKPKKSQGETLRAIWPDLRDMVLPRRGMLALSLLLMVINRVSGLVLPTSTRYMIDNVITKRQLNLLTPMVLGIVLATMVQGVTSFSLTQLLSKTGQRLIAELRRKVQRHVGLLSVTETSDLHLEGHLVRPGRRSFRRSATRRRGPGGARERDVPFAAEQAARRVEADPAAARHVDLGPRMEIDDVAVYAARLRRGSSLRR